MSDEGLVLFWVIAIVFFIGVFFGFEAVGAILITILATLALILVAVILNDKENARIAEKQANADRVAREAEIELINEQKSDYEAAIFEQAEKFGLCDTYSKKIYSSKLVSIITSKFGLALKNDRREKLSPDRYGRVTSQQIEDWKWHLLDVVDSCSLDQNEARVRDLYKQLILLRLGGTSLAFHSIDKSVDITNIKNFGFREHLSNKKNRKEYTHPQLKYYLDSIYGRLRSFFWKTDQ